MILYALFLQYIITHYQYIDSASDEGRVGISSSGYNGVCYKIIVV